VCPFARLVKKNDWALPQVDEEGDVLWPSPLGGFRERKREGRLLVLRRARGSALLCVRERGAAVVCDWWMPVTVCPEDLLGVCTDRLQAFHRVLHGSMQKKCGRRRPEADWYVRWADRGGSYSQSGWSGSKARHTQNGASGSTEFPCVSIDTHWYSCCALAWSAVGVCVHFRGRIDPERLLEIQGVTRCDLLISVH
jgi:hypothetical protein